MAVLLDHGTRISPLPLLSVRNDYCHLLKDSRKCGLHAPLQVSILVDQIERAGIHLARLPPDSTRCELSPHLKLEGLQGLASFTRCQLLDLAWLDDQEAESNFTAAATAAEPSVLL